MIRFNVPDMTCGACANRIGRALAQAGLPADLQLEIDIGARQVRLLQGLDDEGTSAVRRAIEQAGYHAVPASATNPAVRAGGCCCSTRRPAAVDASQGAPARAAGCCS